MEERGMGDFLTYKLYLTRWDQSMVCVRVRPRFDQFDVSSAYKLSGVVLYLVTGRSREGPLWRGQRRGHWAQTENLLRQTRLGQGVWTSPQREPHVRTNPLVLAVRVASETPFRLLVRTETVFVIKFCSQLMMILSLAVTGGAAAFDVLALFLILLFCCFLMLTLAFSSKYTVHKYRP